MGSTRTARRGGSRSATRGARRAGRGASRAGPRVPPPAAGILGFGLDVVEIARIARLLEGAGARAERFLSRCFTPAERAYCDGRRDRAGRYAARFAAKEAAVKALGAPPGVTWTDIEVERGAGAPALRLVGEARAAADRLGVGRIHLTLTHDAGVAAAAVILEGRGGTKP